MSGCVCVSCLRVHPGQGPQPRTPGQRRGTAETHLRSLAAVLCARLGALARERCSQGCSGTAKRTRLSAICASCAQFSPATWVRLRDGFVLSSPRARKAPMHDGRTGKGPPSSAQSAVLLHGLPKLVTPAWMSRRATRARVRSHQVHLAAVALRCSFNALPRHAISRCATTRNWWMVCSCCSMRVAYAAGGATCAAATT